MYPSKSFQSSVGILVREVEDRQPLRVRKVFEQEGLGRMARLAYGTVLVLFK